MDAVRSETDPGSTATDDDTDRSVVFVSQQFPPDRSGHASRIRDMSTALADDGWTVTVLAPPPSFPPSAFDHSWRPVESTTTDGVVVNRLWSPQPTSSDPGFLTRMAYYVVFAAHAFCWLLLNGRRYDVVVTTTPPISTGVAGLTSLLFGQRWVVDVRDLWIDASVSLGFIEEGGALERVSRRYQWFVLHRADSIAVTTTTLGEEVCEQYGDSLSARIELMPNGVDIDRFDESATADAASDESRTDDKSIIIYTGNIGHAQDLDVCIDALTRLPEDTTLRLVGGGDALPALQEQAAEQGLTDRVEFVGPVDHEEIPPLLADADVGIAPLKDDSGLSYAMPTKVYEYLGCRLPVVATGNGELERFMAESEGGVHAKNDPESIAEAIETLLSHDDLRTERAQTGYEHVARQYDRAEIAARFSDHLDGLVADGAA